MDLNVETLTLHWIWDNHQTLSLAFASMGKITSWSLTFQNPHGKGSLFKQTMWLRTWPLGSY